MDTGYLILDTGCQWNESTFDLKYEIVTTPRHYFRANSPTSVYDPDTVRHAKILQSVENSFFLQAVQKRLNARRPKSIGVRRTKRYVATTRDEGNAADERFSTAC